MFKSLMKLRGGSSLTTCRCNEFLEKIKKSKSCINYVVYELSQIKENTQPTQSSVPFLYKKTTDFKEELKIKTHIEEEIRVHLDFENKE